jgi:hypothetical protein
MKKLKLAIKSIALLFTVALVSSCATLIAPPVDHKAAACESFGELRQSWISVVSDHDEMKAQASALSGTLAVWRENDGDEDPLFWKVSDLTEKLFTTLLDGTPESARDYFAAEDADLEAIEEACDLVKTYVPPLKISGGCWNSKTVSAELQLNKYGEWQKRFDAFNLAKIDYCSDPKYPWGVEFTERRSMSDDGVQSFRIIWTDAEGGKFSSGKSKHVSCVVPASRSVNEITVYGSHCKN